jgi:hypothetical protein
MGQLARCNSEATEARDGLRIVAADEIVELHPSYGADYRVTVASGGRHPAFEAGELPDWLRRELKAR